MMVKASKSAGSNSNANRSQDEFKAFLKAAGNKLVVVEFSARWCGPCKRIYPVFHAMSVQYRSVMFANVDVDNARELAQTYQIKAVPTFQLFKQTKKMILPDGCCYSTVFSLCCKNKTLDSQLILYLGSGANP
uniref:Thioredoxin domain containing 8 n=1 Tax=Capra hircus TaxID=9925 RepID=A0A8C2P286_CAPHI